jgi:hypothetical protein
MFTQLSSFEPLAAAAPGLFETQNAVIEIHGALERTGHEADVNHLRRNACVGINLPCAARVKLSGSY